MGEAADKLSQPDRIEQRIEETRSQLDEKLTALEQRARDAMSVRRRVAERPWTVVGGAAAVGLAAGLVKGWRGRGER